MLLRDAPDVVWFSPSSLTAIGLFVVTITGALAAAVVKILRGLAVLRKASTAIVSEQVASKERGGDSDRKLQEVHVLVNSRLVTVLRLLVSVLKKESERTGAAVDLAAYQQAQVELDQAVLANALNEAADQRQADSEHAATKRAEAVAADDRRLVQP